MAAEILLIDKDKSHADALRVYLERQQLDVYQADSTDDVLMMFDHMSADIVLAESGAVVRSQR